MKAVKSLFLAMSMMATVNVYANLDAVKNLQEPEGKKVTFSFGGEEGREYLLDGKPFQIRGGEIHPQRIPRSYWQHRIQMVKAMGLNTIAFYVFWNGIEQPDGSFSFEGMNDIGAFLKLCQEERMWVLFRPGPYVCGEWDLGGIPSYLIKEPGSKLRTTQNPEYIKASTRYLEEMAKVAEPFLCKNGGPILMTQLENEYGSFNTPHSEKAYMELLRDFWTKKGFEPFYTSDGSSAHHLRFALPGVSIGLDPGTNQNQWNSAHSVMGDVPVFSSETYPGWLRHWGEGNWNPSKQTIQSVKWFMKEGKSFSLFMVHGGTNFGFTAGANGHDNFNRRDGINPVDGRFQPDLTSYDYGSPIDEQGAPTAEYPEYRQAIQEALPSEARLPEIPKTPAAMTVSEFTPTRIGGIFDWNARRPVVSSEDGSPTLESFGQNQGMAIYGTIVPQGPEEELDIQYMHDFAMVYLDGKYVGSLDRTFRPKKTLAINKIKLPARSKPARLEILVDTFGHINFHEGMEYDRKGLYGEIKLGGNVLKDWKVIPLPLAPSDVNPKLAGEAEKPALKVQGDYKGSRFRAVFNVQSEADTFLDMSKYTKGYVWVNGHNLGRYWNVGPQQRLYCPKDFLKKGGNVIDIIDLNMSRPAPIKGMVERNKEPGNVSTKNVDNDW